MAANIKTLSANKPRGKARRMTLTVVDDLQAGTIPPLDLAAQEILHLRHDAITPDPDNPRKAFDKTELAELANSIAVDGLIEPLIVRPDEELTVLVAGERRWRAIGLLIADGRWPADRPILCVQRHVAGPAARALALVENIQRVDLKPMEEADAIKALKDIDPAVYTNARLAELSGKTERWVELRLALVANLAPEVKKALADDKIKLAHARELATVPHSLQVGLMKEIERDPEEFTADALKREIDDHKIPLARAGFDTAPFAANIVEIRKGAKVEKFFVDKTLFAAEQKKAAQAKVKELRKEWAWAKLEDYFYGYGYGKSADKTKAGCIVTVDRHSHKIEVHTGLLEKSRGGNNSGAPKTKEEKAKVKAAEEKRQSAEEMVAAADKAAAELSAKLADAIATDSAAAMRVLVFMTMSGYCNQSMIKLQWSHPHDQVVDVDGAKETADDAKKYGVDDDEYISDAVARGEAWAESFQTWIAEKHKNGTSELAPDRARLWDSIAEISERDLPRFLAAIVAQTLQVDRSGGSLNPKLDPAVVGVAGLLGIPVPEPLLAYEVKTKPAKPETAAQPSANGKGKKAKATKAAKAERRSATSRPKNAGDQDVHVKRSADGQIVKVQPGEELPEGEIVLQPGAAHFTPVQEQELRDELAAGDGPIMIDEDETPAAAEDGNNDPTVPARLEAAQTFLDAMGDDVAADDTAEQTAAAGHGGQTSAEQTATDDLLDIPAFLRRS